LVTNPLRPGATYEDIPKNDLPGEDDLRATFKGMAKEVVQGLSNTSYKFLGDNRDRNFWNALATMGKDLKKAENKSARK